MVQFNHVFLEENVLFPKFPNYMIFAKPIPAEDDLIDVGCDGKIRKGFDAVYGYR